MARVKITKRLLDAAELPADGERPYFLWDTEVRGFGACVASSGKRSFVVDYVTTSGDRKRMVIGAYGALSCDEGRALAKVHLGNVARGEDPALERKTRRKAMTVAELCDRYMADAERGLVRGRSSEAKKPSTLALDKGRVDRHIKPLMGKMRVIDVRTPDVYRFFKDVAAGKTAKTYRNPGSPFGNARVTGGAGTARRTTGFLGAIFAYAVTEGVIEHNPARGVRTGSDKVRDRRLSPDEYRVLGDTLKAAEANGEHWQVIAGVRLLALTGCRLGEIKHLTWPEIDQPTHAIRLKDSKTGPSVRPAGRPVFELLARLPRAEGATFVLPAMRKTGRFGGIGAGIERVMRRAGFEDVTAHTLRHSYASTAGDLGFALPTISALLGHAAGSVTARYIHHLDTVLIAAADKVAREILRQMEGPQSAEIVQFPGAAVG
jgi:integrase